MPQVKRHGSPAERLRAWRAAKKAAALDAEGAVVETALVPEPVSMEPVRRAQLGEDEYVQLRTQLSEVMYGPIKGATRRARAGAYWRWRYRAWCAEQCDSL